MLVLSCAKLRLARSSFFNSIIFIQIARYDDMYGVKV